MAGLLGAPGVAEPEAEEEPAAELGAFSCEPSFSTIDLGASDSITCFSRGPALSGRSVMDPALV